MNNKTLTMYLYNIEAMDSVALLWGKVLVFDDISEFSGGFNCKYNKVQTCCV